MSRMPAKPAPAKGDPPGFITTIESVVSVLSILTASFYYYPSAKAKKFCIAVDGLNFHLDEVFCGTSHKKIFGKIALSLGRLPFASPFCPRLVLGLS